MIKGTKAGIKKLKMLFQEAPRVPLGKSGRCVIFSDMHIGDGGGMDDFAPNAALFQAALTRYYEPQKYRLILNGDIEELQRFHLPVITGAWPNLYAAFDRFQRAKKLIRISGNHDDDLRLNPPSGWQRPTAAVRLQMKGKEIFVFHGHQAVSFYAKYNAVVSWALRYLANPLGIRNYTVAYNSPRKYEVESAAYRLANELKIMTVIGHTHRPLFETLSRVDQLRFTIEGLCRRPAKDRRTLMVLRRRVTPLKEELLEALQKKPAERSVSLYSNGLLVPGLFNSGCVIGKRGLTCLEIRDRAVALVHWFDAARSRKYIHYNPNAAVSLPNSPYFRVVLKEEPLDYIFARIELLA